MNLRALRQKQAELKAKGKAILDAADAAGRALTDEEETQFQAIENELTALAGQIEAAERLAERRRAMAVEASPVALAATGTDGYPRVVVGADRAALDPRQGFSSLADFAQAVRRASPGPQQQGIDPRLYIGAAVPANTHREIGQDGYFVPPEFRDRIWELVHDQDNILDECDTEPTTSNVVNDLIDETVPWGSDGIQAYWRTEASQMTATRTKIKPRSIVLNELYAFVTATDELLDDAPRLEARLTKKSAEKISWKIDEAIFTGNGVGQPLGFMNAACLVTVAKETSQTATTFNAQNAAKMFSRMLPQGIARASWRVNSDVLPQLMTMTLGDQPIWTPPSSGFREAPGGFLFGRPVKFSEHCKTLGTVGDVVFADMKGYYALRREGTKFASSMHLYFDYATTAFRWTFRLGGQPHLSAAVSPANGSNTKSHFVVLATRAA